MKIVMHNSSPRHRARAAGPRRGPVRGAVHGFTIFELLISIAVIAVLISLVTLAARAAQRAAGSVVDQSALNQVFEGVRKFREEVGFLPPMVKEYETLDAVAIPSPRVSFGGASTRSDIPWGTIVVTAGSVNQIAVYQKSVDGEFFRGEGSDYRGEDANNYFRDNRYSELTLGYYLAGQLEASINTNAVDVPIDGVPGPGMYKPTKDGLFDVPTSAAEQDPSDRKRVGKEFGPYVDVGDKGIRTVIDVNSATNAAERGRDVTVRDRNDIPIRFYRWLPDRPETIQPTDDPDTTLNLPKVIGRLPSPDEPVVANERNPKTNPQLRTARWAVVVAGPDRVFGDEPLAYIASALGRSEPTNTQEARRLRLDAARDNLVRVGTDEN